MPGTDRLMVVYLRHITNSILHGASGSYRKVLLAQTLKYLEKQDMTNTTTPGHCFTPLDTVPLLRGYQL